MQLRRLLLCPALLTLIPSACEGDGGKQEKTEAVAKADGEKAPAKAEAKAEQKVEKKAGDAKTDDEKADEGKTDEKKADEAEEKAEDTGAEDAKADTAGDTGGAGDGEDAKDGEEPSDAPPEIKPPDELAKGPVPKLREWVETKKVGGKRIASHKIPKEARAEIKALLRTTPNKHKINPVYVKLLEPPEDGKLPSLAMFGRTGGKTITEEQEFRKVLTYSLWVDDGTNYVITHLGFSSRGHQAEDTAEIKSRDIDGDGKKDVMLGHQSVSFHQRTSSLAIFTASPPAMLLLNYFESAGEDGHHGEENLSYACFSKLDDSLVLITLGISKTDEPGRRQRQEPSVSDAFVRNPKGRWESQEVWTVVVAEEEKSRSLLPQWRKLATVKGKKTQRIPKGRLELVRDIPDCPGGRTAPMIVGASTLQDNGGKKLANSGFVLTLGLSLSEDEAKAKATLGAALMGVDASTLRVVKFVKHGPAPL